MMSPLIAATVVVVADDRRGQASGLVTTSRQLGSVVGVAVVAAVLAALPGPAGAAVGFFITAALMVTAGLLAHHALQ